MDISNELYYDMPEDTLRERINKIKKLNNLTNRDIANKTQLSLSTVNELTSGRRKHISMDTLNKLLILGPNILDDYLKFIIDQPNNLEKYNKYDLVKICNVDRSTVERWKNGKYILKEKYYNLLKTRT